MLKVISLVARVAATVLAFLVVVLCFTAVPLRETTRRRRAAGGPAEKTFATFDLKRLPQRALAATQAVRSGVFATRHENVWVDEANEFLYSGTFRWPIGEVPVTEPPLNAAGRMGPQLSVFA